MIINNFENIVSWQKARELTINLYTIFENSRDYGFKDQIQRASISIMNNIAEDFERKGNKEFVRFLYIARGSCAEVRSMLIIAKDLDKINNKDFERLYHITIEITKLLSGLIRKL